MCTYSLFRLLARVFADGSGRKYSPCTSRYGREPPCLLQLLSGIWLYYRLNSSHEFGFSCSHPNALVSFFYEAPSQRKFSGEQLLFALNCQILELLRMLALFLLMTYLSIWAQVLEVPIALIELLAQFWAISYPLPWSLSNYSSPAFRAGQLVMQLFFCLTIVLSLPFFLFCLHFRELRESHIGSVRTPSLRFCWSISRAFNHLRYCVALLPGYSPPVRLSRWLNLHSLCWLSLERPRSMHWRRDGTTNIITTRRGI